MNDVLKHTQRDLNMQAGHATALKCDTSHRITQI